MDKLEALLVTQQRKLKKALAHLTYSFNKVKKLPIDAEQMDDEALETWESFSARFSRVSDIFLTRYIRTKILLNDPGFAGSLRDFLNQAEKLGIIEYAEDWMAIRELRNISAHDYSESDLTHFFERLLKECPKLLAIESQL